MAEVRPKTTSGLSLLRDYLRGGHLRGLGKTFLEPLDRSINQALPISSSPESTLNRGDVIEIQGPTGSGKSELLYLFATYTLLPDYLHLTGHYGRPVALEGRGKSVVLCDCEGKWDIIRLQQVMRGALRLKVQDALPMVDLDAEIVTSQLNSTITASLRHLHIFRPKSSAELAATLLSLADYHFKRMPEEEIRMLLIDGGLSSFFWQDRWNVESTSKVLRDAAASPTAGVVRALQKFRASHDPIIFITNWAIAPLISSPFFFRQHLPPPYPAPFQQGVATPRVSPIEITHHITLYNPNQSPGTENELGLDSGEHGQADSMVQIYGIMRTPPRDTVETMVTHFSFLLTESGVVSIVSPIDEGLVEELDRDCPSDDEP